MLITYRLCGKTHGVRNTLSSKGITQPPIAAVCDAQMTYVPVDAAGLIGRTWLLDVNVEAN